MPSLRPISHPGEGGGGPVTTGRRVRAGPRAALVASGRGRRARTRCRVGRSASRVEQASRSPQASARVVAGGEVDVVDLDLAQSHRRDRGAGSDRRRECARPGDLPAVRRTAVDGTRSGRVVAASSRSRLGAARAAAEGLDVAVALLGGRTSRLHARAARRRQHDRRARRRCGRGGRARGRGSSRAAARGRPVVGDAVEGARGAARIVEHAGGRAVTVRSKIGRHQHHGSAVARGRMAPSLVRHVGSHCRRVGQAPPAFRRRTRVERL